MGKRWWVLPLFFFFFLAFRDGISCFLCKKKLGFRCPWPICVCKDRIRSTPRRHEKDRSNAPNVDGFSIWIVRSCYFEATFVHALAGICFRPSR